MGSWVSALSSFFFSKREYRFLFSGLDAAGKTTILYKLKLDENVTTIPTIGFNVENVNLTMWDVGGREKIRALYKHYYPGTDCILYVVDSADKDRIGESRDELMNMLKDDALSDVVVLVWANKQDLPTAMNTAEITDKLGLHTLRHTWFVQPCCAMTAEGLFDGLDWVKQTLDKLPPKVRN